MDQYNPDHFNFPRTLPRGAYLKTEPRHRRCTIGTVVLLVVVGGLFVVSCF